MSLLYDYCELEERACKQLKLWKAWHITLFILIAIFGVINYTFFQNMLKIVDDKCILYPRSLEFHMVDITNNTHSVFLYNQEKVRYKSNILKTSEGDVVGAKDGISSFDESTPINKSKSENSHPEVEDAFFNESAVINNEGYVMKNMTETEKINNLAHRNKRNVGDTNMSDFEIVVEISNATVVVGNKTHRLMLDNTRTLFGRRRDCEYAEYMPLMSTLVAVVWLMFFAICPAGGISKSHFQHPWHILSPALISCVLLVGLTGYSFALTNVGLHEFCAGFFNLTGSITCSSVHPFLPQGWTSEWEFGTRASAVRASAAGVWAGWACAGAVLVARCLTARDFVMRRTKVAVKRDPKQIITPYLKKNAHSPRKYRDDVISVTSEPTLTSQLVTASPEHDQRSWAPSIVVTPTENREMSLVNQSRASERDYVKDTSF